MGFSNTPSFGKMGMFSASAASNAKMGSFSSTPSTLARSWRRAESSPLSPTTTSLHSISISSPPHSHPSLTTRPDWDAFGAARLSGRQAPKRAGARQPLECVVGRVVLLPGQQLIPTTSVVHSQARSSPWDHPQVITKTWDDENGVRFVKLRTCTSFGGEGIARKKEHQRHYFVEADGSQLAHESDTFSKQTYVNCSPGAELTIEFEHLASWPGSARNPIQFSPTAVVGFDKCEYYRRDSCN